MIWQSSSNKIKQLIPSQKNKRQTSVACEKELDSFGNTAGSGSKGSDRPSTRFCCSGNFGAKIFILGPMHPQRSRDGFLGTSGSLEIISKMLYFHVGGDRYRNALTTADRESCFMRPGVTKYKVRVRIVTYSKPGGSLGLLNESCHFPAENTETQRC